MVKRLSTVARKIAAATVENMNNRELCAIVVWICSSLRAASPQLLAGEVRTQNECAVGGMTDVEKEHKCFPSKIQSSHRRSAREFGLK